MADGSVGLGAANAKSLLLLLFLALGDLGLPAMAARARVGLRNNGYEGLLIAIGERVPEDVKLIDSIKAVFTSASGHMFNATRRRSSFRDITILVPQSWSKSFDYLPSKQETFDKANVIVDPRPGGAQEPYTRQGGACGQEGDYIHLTPDFLTNTSISSNFGDPGKVIVHEWGHLRWGLYDEYPTTDDVAEHFYRDGYNLIKATSCNERFPGSFANRFGNGSCDVDPNTSLYDSNCRFYPKELGTPAGSYMYYNYLESIIDFCDNDTNNVATLHNFRAPSLHNKLCSGRSSWEVMREHTDFAGGANPSVAVNKSYSTNVTFKVVQRKDYAIVVVMDVSGSMSIHNNYIKLDVAVKNYVRYVIPDRSLVGLVYFSKVAWKLTASLQHVNTSSSREALADLMTPTVLGGTSIGSGMEAALELLTNGRDATGSFMVVISDGQENAAPYITTILPRVKAAGVIIDTLLFTQYADPQLLAMAEETGGMAFFYSGMADSTSLIDGLTSTVTSRLQKDTATAAITVASRVIMVPNNSTEQRTVIIDNDLGADTRFTFSWSEQSYRCFIVVSNGVVGQNYSTTSSTTTSKTFIFNGTAVAGTWTVTVQNMVVLEDAAIAMQVESKPAPGSKASPISVDVESTEQTLDFAGALRPLTVFAHVKKDYSAVLEAIVIATLESPNGTRIELRLRDSGAGADAVKNDGTYSGFFFRVPQIGTYSVSVRVEGTNETTVATQTGTGSRAARVQRPGDVEETRSVATQPTGTFERAASGGLITVRSLPPAGRDTYPPSRIQDLRIVEARHDIGQVTLQFTAVGDDYDQGRARRYVLKHSNNYTDLYYNFLNATDVKHEDILVGNLSSPSEANTLETFIIRVEKDNFVAFGIVAVDSASNQGLPSNIVTTKLTYTPSTVDAPNNTALIIGLTVGAAILIAAIIAAVCYAKRQIRAKKANKC